MTTLLMASPPTLASIGFFTSSGNVSNGPAEWMPGYVVLGIPASEWEQVALKINGEPVPLSIRRLGNEARVVAEWPRSGPGRYWIALSAPFPCETVFEIRPAKISETSFDRMLLDLEQNLPSSIAMSLQRMGGLVGVALIDPDKLTLAEELKRLERAVRGSLQRAGLVEVLNRMTVDPHHVLHAEERWVPQERARRPSNTRLISALTRFGNLTEDYLPRKLVDITSRRTVDVYENRLTLLFVTIVARRLRRLAKLAPQEELLEDTYKLIAEMQTARRVARFLEEVTPLPFVPHNVSMVLLKRSDYRAMLEGYLELQRSMAVRLDSDQLEHPLENLPWLYQIWGLLQTFDVLLGLAADSGYKVVSASLIRHGPGEIFVKVIPNGQVAIELVHDESGTRVRLIPERTFRRDGSLKSLSFNQRPDVVVEVTRPNGAIDIFLLDPKYKLDGEISNIVDPADAEVPKGQPKKVDIDKMHAYRDSIRDETGGRVVRYAGILYPGPDKGYGPGIEALQALPGFDERLRNRLAEILAVAISPNQGVNPQYG